MGQAPLTLLAIITVYLALHLPHHEDTNWKAKLRRVDFLGALILVTAVFTLLLGLDHGSNVSWKSLKIWGLLCTSIALFLVFAYVETKVAQEPFAPGRIIFQKSLFACYLCNFFSFGGWLAAIFYIPLYDQAVNGVTASQAGARLLPAIFAGVSGSLFAGFLMKKTGRYYSLTVAAYMGLLWGFVPILLFSGLVAKSTLGVAVGLAICGFSNGIGVTSSLIALSEFSTLPLIFPVNLEKTVAQASNADQAVVTACSYLFRSLGSVIGVALSATVVQQFLRLHLHETLDSGKEADEIIRRVRQSLDSIKTLEPMTRELVRQSYAKATRAGFFVDACIVAGATISAFWIREYKLSR